MIVIDENVLAMVLREQGIDPGSATALVEEVKESSFMMSRAQAETTAKSQALRHAQLEGSPAYVKEVLTNPNWKPHSWVVDSILLAVNGVEPILVQ